MESNWVNGMFLLFGTLILFMIYTDYKPSKPVRAMLIVNMIIAAYKLLVNLL